MKRFLKETFLILSNEVKWNGEFFIKFPNFFRVFSNSVSHALPHYSVNILLLNTNQYYLTFLWSALVNIWCFFQYLSFHAFVCSKYFLVIFRMYQKCLYYQRYEVENVKTWEKLQNIYSFWESLYQFHLCFILYVTLQVYVNRLHLGCHTSVLYHV